MPEIIPISFPFGKQFPESADPAGKPPSTGAAIGIIPVPRHGFRLLAHLRRRFSGGTRGALGSQEQALMLLLLYLAQLNGLFCDFRTRLPLAIHEMPELQSYACGSGRGLIFAQ